MRHPKLSSPEIQMQDFLSVSHSAIESCQQPSGHRSNGRESDVKNEMAWSKQLSWCLFFLLLKTFTEKQIWLQVEGHFERQCGRREWAPWDTRRVVASGSWALGRRQELVGPGQRGAPVALVPPGLSLVAEPVAGCAGQCKPLPVAVDPRRPFSPGPQGLARSLPFVCYSKPPARKTGKPRSRKTAPPNPGRTSTGSWRQCCHPGKALGAKPSGRTRQSRFRSLPDICTSGRRPCPVRSQCSPEDNRCKR